MSRLSPDQVEAFEAMAAAGRSVDELAAKFGLHPTNVRARVRKLLARASFVRPVLESGPVKLTEAQAFQCRFCIEPESQPPHAEMLVCGKRVVEGKSWCPACAQLVWPRTGSRRTATIDKGSSAWGAAIPDMHERGRHDSDQRNRPATG